MNREEFGRILAQKRMAMDESQGDFGARFGLTQQAVANWESGGSLPGKKILKEVCRIIDVPFEQASLLRRAPKPLLTSWQEPYVSVEEPKPTYATATNFTQAPEDRQAPRPVPVISWVAAGGWEYAADPHPPGHADEWVDSSWARSPNSFALVTHGDSMAPEFCEGDIIVVDPDVPPHNGSFVIAKNGAEATFKQLIVDGDRRYLKPLNPRYPIIDGVGFRVVGVVVEKKKRYT